MRFTFLALLILPAANFADHAVGPPLRRLEAPQNGESAALAAFRAVHSRAEKGADGKWTLKFNGLENLQKLVEEPGFKTDLAGQDKGILYELGTEPLLRVFLKTKPDLRLVIELNGVESSVGDHLLRIYQKRLDWEDHTPQTRTPKQTAEMELRKESTRKAMELLKSSLRSD